MTDDNYFRVFEGGNSDDTIKKPTNDNDANFKFVKPQFSFDGSFDEILEKIKD